MKTILTAPIFAPIGAQIPEIIVVRGGSATRIEDIENAVIVFKDGIGYDAAQLGETARGMTGLR